MPANFSTSLSTACSEAVRSTYPPMQTACDLPPGPVSLTGLTTDPKKASTAACSDACKNALRAFATTSNTVCGTARIFRDDSSTAATVSAQTSLLVEISCVKDEAGGPCIVGQINALKANGVVSNSANLISEITSFALKNQTFACSKCAGDEVKALQAAPYLNPETTQSVETAVVGLASLCPAKDQKTNGAGTVSAALGAAASAMFYFIC